LVGTIILTSLNMGVWTFIGAVIRFYGWFGDARGVYIIIFIGTMGFAAAQLIVGILGIVVFRGNVNNGKGRKLRCPRCCSVIALGSSLASRPRRVLASWWGWHKDWRRSQSRWPPPSPKRTTLPTRPAGARHCHVAFS